MPVLRTLPHTCSRVRGLWGSSEIQAQLRRLGSVFLNHREVSAQEAVYKILSLPLKELSLKVVFVNTGFKKDRVRIVKKDGALQALDDNDEDFYRPASLTGMLHAHQN